MPASRHVGSLTLALLLCAAAETATAQALPERNLCTEPAGPVALGSAQWNGWGRDLDNTRYQPEPAIRATDVPRLALKWAFGYQAGTVSGQPTIVDGRVFVASATGRVYSLDSKTGCTYWTYDAAAGIESAVSIGELAAPRMPARTKKSKRKLTLAHLEVQKAPSAAFFGDDKGSVYALDARKGNAAVEDASSMCTRMRASRRRRFCFRTGCMSRLPRASQAPRRMPHIRAVLSAAAWLRSISAMVMCCGKPTP